MDKFRVNENLILLSLSDVVNDLDFGEFNVRLAGVHIHPGHTDSPHYEHVHEFTEIHVPISGEAIVKSDKARRKISHGKFAIHPPEQRHTWKAVKSPFVTHIWWFKFIQAENISDMTKKALSPFLDDIMYTGKLPADYWNLYNNLIREIKEKNFLYVTNIQCMLMKIIVLFIRTCAFNKSHRIKWKANGVYDKIVRKVDDYLVGNLSYDVKLQDLSKMTNMSQRNLSRHYKNITKQTIGKRLELLRMQKAEELVRETDLQIKEIAYKCGYRHKSHFSSIFFKNFHKSPVEYRRELSSDMKKIGLSTQSPY